MSNIIERKQKQFKNRSQTKVDIAYKSVEDYISDLNNIHVLNKKRFSFSHIKQNDNDNFYKEYYVDLNYFQSFLIFLEKAFVDLEGFEYDEKLNQVKTWKDWLDFYQNLMVKMSSFDFDYENQSLTIPDIDIDSISRSIMCINLYQFDLLRETMDLRLYKYAMETLSIINQRANNSFCYGDCAMYTSEHFQSEAEHYEWEIEQALKLPKDKRDIDVDNSREIVEDFHIAAEDCMKLSGYNHSLVYQDRKTKVYKHQLSNKEKELYEVLKTIREYDIYNIEPFMFLNSYSCIDFSDDSEGQSWLQNLEKNGLEAPIHLYYNAFYVLTYDSLDFGGISDRGFMNEYVSRVNSYEAESMFYFECSAKKVYYKDKVEYENPPEREAVVKYFDAFLKINQITEELCIHQKL